LLRRIGIAVSVGLADSLNPSTIGPALYLATAAERVRRVIEFTIGVFGVNLLAGVLLTIGPGRLLLGLVPHPRGTAKHVIELVVGVVLLAVALGVWLGRGKLARRSLPMSGEGSSSSALVTGASIAAVELPTAAPYFAVIAGITASDAAIPQELLLLVLYNVAFVLPLIVIVLILVLARDRADPLLARVGEFVQREWPVVLAGLLLFVGAVLTLLGGAGLVKE
jgi:cytochrome c biogenesis protein CcdA